MGMGITCLTLGGLHKRRPPPLSKGAGARRHTFTRILGAGRNRKEVPTSGPWLGGSRRPKLGFRVLGNLGNLGV